MSKIITLKDKNTSEVIYPTVQSSLVIDENGSNICGILEKKEQDLSEYLNMGMNKLTNTIHKIKTLKNLKSGKNQKKLSDCITNNHISIEKQKNIENITSNIENIIDAGNVVSKDDDIYTNSEIIDLVSTVIQDRNYIQYGTPKFAPVNKEIMVDDEKIYIGLNGVWYVINSSN